MLLFWGHHFSQNNRSLIAISLLSSNDSFQARTYFVVSSGLPLLDFVVVIFLTFATSTFLQCSHIEMCSKSNCRSWSSSCSIQYGIDRSRKDPIPCLVVLQGWRSRVPVAKWAHPDKQAGREAGKARPTLKAETLIGQQQYQIGIAVNSACSFYY